MNKEVKLNITKEKLMAATLCLMEDKDDPYKVTSREIASKAGVNVAMINYCFESRENLIYSAFQNEYSKFLQSSDAIKLINSSLPPKEILKGLHFIVAKFLVNNYKFTKAITGLVVFERDLSQDAFSLQYVLKHYDGRKTLSECKLIAYELSTTMQIIIYRMDDFKNSFGIDLTNEDELKHYIDLRIDLLLN